MKIAVIGSGISGLASAFLLDKEHDVTLIEKSNRLGGHANTVQITVDDQDVSVDTGFLVFNEKNYPLFTQLLTHLNVGSSDTEMSFSVSDKKSEFEFRPTGFRTIFPDLSNLHNLSFLNMLIEIPRFNFFAKKALESEQELKLGEVITSHRFSSFLTKYYITPLASSIWSSSTSDVLEMPIRTYANFMYNHGLISFGNQPTWKTIPGGSKNYVEAIRSRLKYPPRLSCQPVSVRRDTDGVEIGYPDGHLERFDAIFIATHANDVFDFLKDPSPVEREFLGKFRFSLNKVLLHLDSSLLPRHERVHASWNFHVTEESDQKVTVTYLLNKLQPINTKRHILASLGMEKFVRDEMIIDTFDYEHPILDQSAISGQALLQQLQGCQNTYYAGAWLKYGFHEDGLKSAFEAVKEFYEKTSSKAYTFLA